MKLKIQDSYKTVVFTIFFVIFLWFIYSIRDILIEVFSALLLMTILNPFVSRISRFKIPRGLAVLVVYFVLIGFVGGVLAGLVKPLVEQTTNFASGFPEYIAQMGLPIGLGDKLVQEIATSVGGLPSQAIKYSVSLLSNAVSVLFVLVFTAYLLISRKNFSQQLGDYFGDTRREKILSIIDEVEAKLGAWTRGELILMLLVGLLTYVGLSILGVPYALPLSLLAGMLEIVPNFGPILAAVPAVIVGFGASPIIGLATTALAFLVQQIENYIFVPRVMQKSVGVSPLVTLLALSIGFRMAGVVGALMSIPVVLASEIIVRRVLK